MPTFSVRCIKYTQSHERFFTIGKEYEVNNGRITNDNGYTYYDSMMTPNSNPRTWFLASWYEFEVVDLIEVPDYLEISFDDIIN